MRILLVEDDNAVAEFIREGLETERHSVEVAEDGERAQDQAQRCSFDLIILDLNLPGCDGLEVLRSIRRTEESPPVLILTCRSSVEDRVKGLDSGADDYLSKPFSFSELAARVRALTRRGNAGNGTILRFDDLEIDRVARSVRRRDRTVLLTPREFALLEFLARHAGLSVTRAMIAEGVWNHASDTMTNVVDVYINYLRNKIDAGFERKLIHTVRGVGYQFGDRDRRRGHGYQSD
jgi:DNA-binding response OmpR family regulator